MKPKSRVTTGGGFASLLPAVTIIVIVLAIIFILLSARIDLHGGDVPATVEYRVQQQQQHQSQQHHQVDKQHENHPHDESKETATTAIPAPTKPHFSRVSIAALLTSNSKRGETLTRAIDGLAVLRRSVLEVYGVNANDEQAVADLGITFSVLVTRSVDYRWIDVLKKIGWTDIHRYDHAPIVASHIANPQIAKEIVSDGAIGIDELIKLNVFQWGKEFDVVLLVDCDVLFHKRLDELLTPTGKALRWTRGGWVSEKINGGFLVIEPKHAIGERHRQKMLDIVLEGDFRPGTGWRGSGIGWTYGGRTIQGVLPYYFFVVARKNVSDEASGDDMQIERCRYNNMDQLPECKAMKFDDITSNHFTGDCVKPWWCGVKRSVRCAFWAKRWNYLLAAEMKRYAVLNAKELEDTSYACGSFGSLADRLIAPMANP